MGLCAAVRKRAAAAPEERLPGPLRLARLCSCAPSACARLYPARTSLPAGQRLSVRLNSRPADTSVSASPRAARVHSRPRLRARAAATVDVGDVGGEDGHGADGAVLHAAVPDLPAPCAVCVCARTHTRTHPSVCVRAVGRAAVPDLPAGASSVSLWPAARGRQVRTCEKDMAWNYATGMRRACACAHVVGLAASPIHRRGGRGRGSGPAGSSNRPPGRR